MDEQYKEEATRQVALIIQNINSALIRENYGVSEVYLSLIVFEKILRNYIDCSSKEMNSFEIVASEIADKIIKKENMN